jgi:hypothetical protein
MQRRHLLTASAALLFLAQVLLAQVASAVAQTYPSRPIRQIVPYASGSAAAGLRLTHVPYRGVIPAMNEWSPDTSR